MRFLLLIAVATGCQTYAQHRAALVPHATPLPTDGQPLPGSGEVALGATSIADLVSPGAGNPNAGDTVPGTQLRGSVAGRINDRFSLGLVYEQGLDGTSHAVTSSQPPIGHGDVSGYAAQAIFSLPTSVEGFRVGLAIEMGFWSVPWVQYTSCVMNCAQPFTVMETGADSVPSLALAVVPSYRTGRFTVFGGATARNHPTIAEKIETVVPDSDADVQAGPFNLILHAGAAVELGGGVRASLIVHQTVTRDPVSYGPALAAMLAIPFGATDAPKKWATPSVQ